MFTIDLNPLNFFYEVRVRWSFSNITSDNNHF